MLTMRNRWLPRWRRALRVLSHRDFQFAVLSCVCFGLAVGLALSRPTAISLATVLSSFLVGLIFFAGFVLLRSRLPDASRSLRSWTVFGVGILLLGLAAVTLLGTLSRLVSPGGTSDSGVGFLLSGSTVLLVFLARNRAKGAR